MINNVVLMGRLTGEPELKSTTTGIAIARFTVAVERDYKVNDEKVTDFLPCVAWRQTAEFISKWFRKGSMIAVQGAIETGKYEDKDGNKKTSYEVNVARASFCGSKNEAGEAAAADHETAGDKADADDGDDMLPF